MDVCLVNMPYTGIARPSAALGLLQAVLEHDGLTAKTVYADLLFADKIGLRTFKHIIDTRAPDALGDWTFAHVAFPGFQPDTTAYVDRLIERNTLYIDCEPAEFKAVLPRVRNAAAEFIEELVARILSHRPRLVGCTSTLVQHVSSLALLRRLRDVAPEVIGVIGGANCEAEMGRATHRLFPWVDYVVAGEGDGVITPLTHAVLEHGRDAPPHVLPEGVYGPVHRRVGYPAQSNEATGVAPRATSGAVAGLPAPNYDDYFETLEQFDDLRRNIIPSLPIESSRGCWWGQGKSGGCTFCSLNGCGKRFRSKSADTVIKELDTLSERYGVHRFYAVDNCVDMRYFKTLFPQLAGSGKPYRIYYELRANPKRMDVQVMREAGITWVWCGVESLHHRILEIVNKGCNSYQNVQFLKWCRQYGIFVGWNVMCDFPDEHDEWYAEMAELLPLLTHLQPPRGFVRLRLDRFSHYHNHAAEYGLELRPSELAPYVYPLSGEDLWEQTYFFEDEERARFPQVSSLLKRPGMRATAREMGRWKRAFWAGNLPVLSMTSENGRLFIRDTRPAAVAPSFTLEGLPRAIYLACDEGTRVDRLTGELKQQGHTRADIDAAVQNLLEKKLMVELDDRLLALATEEPLQELPGKVDYPGGEVRAWIRSPEPTQ